MKIDELRKIALSKVKPRQLSKTCSVASVAAAIESENGNVYIGVCIDTSSSLGNCAEHSAINQMITNGESLIKKVVAVGNKGEIYPPCGRCRELIYQVNNKNMDAEILVNESEVVKLSQILPHITY